MKRSRFPQRVKRGSCIVTIYRTPNKGYPTFTVAHYDAKGNFCRRTFPDFKRARELAEGTAEDLAGGTSDTHVLTDQELLIYRRATEALKDVGVPLNLAAIQFVRSMVNANIRIGDPTTDPCCDSYEQNSSKVLHKGFRLLTLDGHGAPQAVASRDTTGGSGEDSDQVGAVPLEDRN